MAFKSFKLEKIAAPFYAIPFVMRSSRLPFIGMSIMLVLQGLIAPVLTVLLGLTVQHFAQEGPNNFAASIPLGYIVLAWALLFLSSAIFQTLAFSLSGRMNEDISTYMQEIMLKKGLSLKTLAFFDKPETFDMLSIVVNESKSRPSNYIVLYSCILKDVVTLLSYVFLIASISVLAPLALFLASLPLTFAYVSMREQNWLGIKVRATQARFLEYISHLYLQRDAFIDLRLNKTQDFFLQAFQEHRRSLLSHLRAQRHKGIMKNLPLLVVGVAGYALAIFLLLNKASTMGILISTLAASLQAFLALQATINSLVDNISFISEKAFFFKDLKAFLATREDNEYNAADLSAKVSELAQDTDALISFQGVSYAYPSAPEVPVLQNVSFSIKEGERIAIVGENGAGKSTILKLLTGMCLPTAGSITVAGMPLSYENLDSWREHISMVPQKPHAFALDVKDNIAFGEHSALEVQEVLDTMHSSSGLALDKQLGIEFGGQELSGGQQQRLSIARALMRNTPVLLLDEPTSAIDPIYEAELFDTLIDLTKGKTSVIVTHRIPQALAADRVLVIQKGQLVEEGSPQRLIEQQGLFATMVSEQLRILQHEGA